MTGRTRGGWNTCNLPLLGGCDGPWESAKRETEATSGSMAAAKVEGTGPAEVVGLDETGVVGLDALEPPAAAAVSGGGGGST